MRPDFAQRAFSTFFIVSVAAWPALAQTRDQIREQNEQLYQQYQQNGAGDPTAVAPPIGGDAAASAPPQGGSAGGGGGGNLVAQLLDRVSRLEEQNRELSGRVDELARDLQIQTASLNKQIGDLGFAVQQGHGGAVGAAPGAAMPAAPIAPAPPPPSARSTRAARTAAAAVPATPPPGPRGAGQVYKLATGYTAAGNYRQAALAYYDVYNRQPRGPLAPDALLHVSSSMVALGQNGAACEALAKLRAEFPAARGNVARTAAVLRGRAHC